MKSSREEAINRLGNNLIALSARLYRIDVDQLSIYDRRDVQECRERIDNMRLDIQFLGNTEAEIDEHIDDHLLVSGLLKAYISYIRDEEGADWIFPIEGDKSKFTDEEWEHLLKISKSQQGLDR